MGAADARGACAGHRRSMRGLSAARVMSDFYETVTVIDRDQLPDRPEPRRMVPQGQQVHGLLVRGAAVLEDSSPGS